MRKQFIALLKFVVLSSLLLSVSLANAATRQTLAAHEYTPLNEIELESLVSPIALYPDELVAIVLPAATQPLQIVQANRFLHEQTGGDVKVPPKDWDDAIVALLNYPEALALLDSDLNWTAQLGDAVRYQENAVIDAIQTFRHRVHDAGNLSSDEKKTVRVDNGVINVTSAQAQQTYIPYYEPAQVIYAQPQSVYHYYPNAYPVYYYPYRRYSSFFNQPFWGLTTAFTVGWLNRGLYTHPHHYRSHPYHGRRYHRAKYHRRTPFNRGRYHRHYRGDDWYPNFRRHSRRYPADRARSDRTARRSDARNPSSRERIRRNGDRRRAKVTARRPAHSNRAPRENRRVNRRDTRVAALGTVAPRHSTSARRPNTVARKSAAPAQPATARRRPAGTFHPGNAAALHQKTKPAAPVRHRATRAPATNAARGINRKGTHPATTMARGYNRPSHAARSPQRRQTVNSHIQRAASTFNGRSMKRGAAKGHRGGTKRRSRARMGAARAGR